MMDSEQSDGSERKPRILIIGVGNEYRRDDAAGLHVARHLKQMSLPDDVTVVESDGGMEILEVWRDAETVILIDAVRSGAAVGTIHRFDAAAQGIPRSILAQCSTHALSLVDAIEIARSLNQIPSSLIVYGIEGKQFEGGTGLSPEVERAAGKAATCVLGEIPENPRCDHRHRSS
jgi:hydrogenase maturation protease